ncbi:hypothetical protein [Marimonas arenosa]|uniref:Uncharacterized protein n=1 Tax=Marimonas arenosa TaxID=1795305 RepID=A0AAE3WGS5_9RHOB|nr:hypothetical protein [Marimonas arenosa]MDQ2092339.1 hypothetical protein [Marimonas arenosa]
MTEDTAQAPPPGTDAVPAPDSRLVSLAVKTVLVLAVFFFLVSLVQLSYLHWTLQKTLPSGVPGFAERILNAPDPGDIARQKLAVASLLESEAIVRRHENAHVTQMGHLWIRYLGSVTGMIMAVIGSVFILARVRTPGRSEISGEYQNFKLAMASASPGLILVVLGCLMMTIAVLSQNTSTVTDGALYAPFAGSGSAGTEFTVPNLPSQP